MTLKERERLELLQRIRDVIGEEEPSVLTKALSYFPDIANLFIEAQQFAFERWGAGKRELRNVGSTYYENSTSYRDFLSQWKSSHLQQGIGQGSFVEFYLGNRTLTPDEQENFNRVMLYDKADDIFEVVWLIQELENLRNSERVIPEGEDQVYQLQIDHTLDHLRIVLAALRHPEQLAETDIGKLTVRAIELLQLSDEEVAHLTSILHAAEYFHYVANQDSQARIKWLNAQLDYQRAMTATQDSLKEFITSLKEYPNPHTGDVGASEVPEVGDAE